MRMPRTLPLWLALLGTPVPARAQAPAPGTPAPAPAATAPAQAGSPTLPGTAGQGAADDGSTPVIDLAHRYRFAEYYAGRDPQAAPGTIGPYRVTAQETIKDSGESAGAGEVAREVEYIERPAEISGLGAVNATVRTYVGFRSRPEEKAAGGTRLLEGLTVWYHPQRDAAPLLISLVDGRRLREREYELAARQVYVPSLVGLLPTQSVRIGDTWRIPRRAIQALLAEPEVRGDNLRGKFVELRRPASGAGLLAVFSVTGSVVTQQVETLVNAELTFAFAPPKPAADAARKAALVAADDSLVDARGAIIRLLMARVAEGTRAAPAGPAASPPRKYRAEQQLVLNRRLGGTFPSVRGDLPTSAPAATVANSWLIFTDPAGRFTFQHPQDLLPPPRGQASSNALFLTRGGADGRDRDLLQIDLFDERREPQALKDVVQTRLDQLQSEVVRGGEEWLPASEWPGLKVFHLEAAARTSGRGPRAPRLHFDAYLVQFHDRATAIVIATTTRDAVPGFRREVEQVLKTFRPLSNG